VPADSQAAGSRYGETVLRSRLAAHMREPLYRQSYLMLTATGISAVTGFAFWIIAARSASTQEVGLAAGYFAATSFLSYLTSLGLPYSLLRFGSSDDFSGAVNAALWLSAITSVLGAVVFRAGITLWSPRLLPPLANIEHVAIFAFFSVGVAIGLLLDSLFAARRRAGLAVVRAAVSGLGKLVLLPVLGYSGFGIAVSILLPTAICSIAMWIGLPVLLGRHSHGVAIRGAPTRTLCGYGFQTFPAALLAGAPPFVLPLLVLATLGAKEMAYFYVAWNIAFVVQLVPSVISQLTLSEGAKDLGYVRRKGIRFSMAATVPLVAIIVVGAPLILRVYGGTYTSHAETALRLFCLAAVPSAVVSIAGAFMRVQHRHGQITTLNAVLCVLALGLAALGGHWNGLSGTAAGWLTGMTMAGVLAAIVLTSSLTGQPDDRGEAVPLTVPGP
jgi:O-antigen/teichoic acid export membrane protein